MIVALDALYGDDGSALVAAVGFESFDSARPCWEDAMRVEGCEPYEPGQFARRELPCLLAILKRAPRAVSVAIVDGHVDLDAQGKPGLGRKLWDALGRSVPVVGVAKTAFAGVPAQWETLRGQSKRPLYVSAAGMDQCEAARAVVAMHGADRTPTLLRRVDALSRGSAPMESSSEKAPPKL